MARYFQMKSKYLEETRKSAENLELRQSEAAAWSATYKKLWREFQCCYYTCNGLVFNAIGEDYMNNYDELASKAKAKADAIREAIKEEMVRQNTEELVAGAYIVRFTNVISNRFDSTTFKRLYADLYKDFTKPVSCRRFSVSC